jgi:hypothetical protein
MRRLYLFSWLLIQKILEDAGGGEGVDSLAFLHAGVVAGEFAFGVVGGEVFADAVDGGGGDGLLEGQDEAFGEFGLLGDSAVGVEGEADDDGVDGFAADELGEGGGKLLVGKAFEHFEGEGHAGFGVADGDAGSSAAVIDADSSHGDTVTEGAGFSRRRGR